jgi:hypothetical protein
LADEFGTMDSLAIIPYHRESRRVDGMQLVTVEHLQDPYGIDEKLYQYGIAVGDYPLDHHRAKNPDPVEIGFPSIPSFSIPYGALVPKSMDGLIVAEKSISTSSLANGSTRLQPCVMTIGQAAGMAAVICVEDAVQPRDLDVRSLQSALIKSGAYIQPYLDITREDWYFEPLQKLGAAGIIVAHGVPHQWANQTWIYPDSSVQASELETWALKMEIELGELPAGDISIAEAKAALGIEKPVKALSADAAALTRKEAAVLLLMKKDPFEKPLHLR